MAAMTPEELIDYIIQRALTTAYDFTEKVDTAAWFAIAANGGGYQLDPEKLTGFIPEAIEPEIPEVADSLITYEAQVQEIVALLSGELGDFFTKYYPLESDAFDESTVWLVNTITNGGTGINVHIEDQVWQRARERVIVDGRRVENQLVLGFAAKGYMMPAGAMNRKLMESRFDQAGKTGEASTAIGAKQLEIEIETIKFAIGESLKSRQMAMAAAADYIRAISTAPDSAAKVANINVDNKARMMSAAADWYRARQGRDEMVLKSKLAEMNTGFSTWKQKGDVSVGSSSNDIRGIEAAADAYGKTAQAALTSLNSIVSTSVNSFS